MKKLFFTVSIFILSIGMANAQTAAKTIYFELGGPGIASFNYDMRLQKKEDGIGFRIGVGGFSINDEGAIFVPLGLNYLIGKDGKNYFEVGGGVTIVSIHTDLPDDNDKGTFETTFGHAYFGYRLQPKNGGFLFRAGITPIFNRNFFIPYYAGISFGYKF